MNVYLKNMLNFDNNYLFNIVDNVKESEKDKVYYNIINSSNSLSDNFYKLDYERTYVNRNSNIVNIDFSNSYFSLEKWDIAKIADVFPTDFGAARINGSFNDLKDANYNVSETNYKHWNEVIEHWQKFKTYCVPLVIIFSKDFPEAKLFGDYQLFEGHGRLGWIKCFSQNFDENKVNRYHYVWVLRKNKIGG